MWPLNLITLLLTSLQIWFTHHHHTEREHQTDTALVWRLPAAQSRMRCDSMRACCVNTECVCVHHSNRVDTRLFHLKTISYTHASGSVSLYNKKRFILASGNILGSNETEQWRSVSFSFCLDWFQISDLTKTSNNVPVIYSRLLENIKGEEILISISSSLSNASRSHSV